MAPLRALDRTSVRFVLTGAWNTAFGYIATASLYWLFSARLHYLVIMALGTVLAITNAFVCHKLFVFRTKGNTLREYLRYYVVYAVPTGIGFVGLPFCIEVLQMNFYLAQAILTSLTVIVSYFGHKHISFRR